ncbi:MAG TPA: universal stress protein [Bacteroidia bacterium]
MINKIICPTDFSEAANNATEYAAKLAQVFGVKLVFVNVQKISPLSTAVSLAGESEVFENENAILASNRLKELCSEVNKFFKIPTDHEMNVTTQSLAKAISSHGKLNSLIVMGTNGADNLIQFFWGTNTFNVIKNARCPVLLIPENCSYSNYKSIVYAISYYEKGKLALHQFHQFVSAFNAQITFLHVSKKDTSISRDVFNVEKEEIENFFGEKQKLDFKRVFSDDPADAIEDYISENPTDLLVLAARNRSIINSIFSQIPIIQGLSSIASYPILVFHS